MIDKDILLNFINRINSTSTSSKFDYQCKEPSCYCCQYIKRLKENEAIRNSKRNK